MALAVHHLGTGRPDRTIEALEQLPGDEALSPYALLVRGRALLALDRDAEARAVAQRAVSVTPDDAGLWSLLADACAALDDLPAAEHAVLAALRLRPDSADLMADYARVLAQAGQDDKADRVLRRAAELDPESSQVADARTFLALARGDDRVALQAAQQALARDPGSVAAQSMLGVTSLLRGDGATAWRASRSAAGASIGNAQLAELARESRMQAHPAMAGMRLITRFGPVRVWVFGIALLLLARAVLPPALAFAVACGWLLFCVYSWTVEAVLRRWARWRW